MSAKRLWLGALLVLTGGLATAQIDSDTLTVAASRQVYVPRDQVLFGFSVNAGPKVGLEEIVAALQGVGIMGAAFSAVHSYPQSQTASVDWSFTLAVPFSKLNATIALLGVAQERIAKQPGGLTLTFDVLRTQSSTGIECPVADLIADAQGQAHKLADAAGLSLGHVVALSDGSVAVPTAVFRLGDFSFNSSQWFDYTPTLICSVVVTYKLLRFQ